MEWTLKLKNEWIRLQPKKRMYSCSVPLLGLTGSIATGKSFVLKILREKQFPVLCADQLVKKIYQKTSSMDFIRNNFPQALAGENIDFKVLRKEIFTNPEKKRSLEIFIYDQLPEMFHQTLEEMGTIPFLIYDVPLLFERKLERSFDVILCVYANPEIELQRLMQRDQISRELGQQMIDSQMPIDLKKAKADIVIMNEGTIEELRKEVDRTIQQLFGPS